MADSAILQNSNSAKLELRDSLSLSRSPHSSPPSLEHHNRMFSPPRMVAWHHGTLPSEGGSQYVTGVLTCCTTDSEHRGQPVLWSGLLGWDHTEGSRRCSPFDVEDMWSFDIHVPDKPPMGHPHFEACGSPLLNVAVCLASLLPHADSVGGDDALGPENCTPI